MVHIQYIDGSDYFYLTLEEIFDDKKKRQDLYRNKSIAQPNINIKSIICSFSNIKEEWKKIELLPNYDREIEKFINPEEEGWQSRYYQTLFSENNISSIVDNYLEGLLWNVNYYSKGCIDWTWKYKYHYPPLLCDLLKYGKQSIQKIKFNTNTTAVNEITQLCYVVPSSSLHIIPNQIRKRLMKYSHLYPSDCVFMWAFCKYFWESHVMLPEIDISFIEKIINS